MIRSETFMNTRNCNDSTLASSDLGDLVDPARYHAAVDITGIPTKSLRRLLECMVLVRAAEEKIGDEVAAKSVRCPCHLVIGQEAVAAAIAEQIQTCDRVFGAHRSHAHYLSLGGDLRRLLAEVQGKDTGCSKGMGGSMHLIDIEHQLFGTVPIVGATIPIATGAALAAKLEGSSAVAVSFFGDGATEEGVFHESLNLASVMRLPVVYVCENNLFSSHLRIDLRQPKNSTCRYAEAHAIPWQRVDGNDVAALYRVASKAFAGAREGNGPFFIEAVTYRWRGHVGPREDLDVGVRRKDDLALWKKRDPILRLAEALYQTGIMAPAELEQLWSGSRQRVQAAWRQAEQDPFPPPEALLDRVYFTGGKSGVLPRGESW